MTLSENPGMLSAVCRSVHVANELVSAMYHVCTGIHSLDLDCFGSQPFDTFTGHRTKLELGQPPEIVDEQNHSVVSGVCDEIKATSPWMAERLTGEWHESSVLVVHVGNPGQQDVN